MPYSLRIVCGFFNVPQLFATRVVRQEPPAHSLYPRRLESLTICWCNYKDSTFYSVIFKTLSVGPAGVKLTTSRMTAWFSTNWATGAWSRDLCVRCAVNTSLCNILAIFEIWQFIIFWYCHLHLIFSLLNVITWKRSFSSLSTLSDSLILQSTDSLSHKTKNKHLIFKLISPFRLFYPLKISDQPT